MSAEDGTIQSFEKFWPYYVGEHRKTITRALHYTGTSVGLLCAYKALRSGNLKWIPVGLLCSYGPSWIGHFFVEHNRPATLTYPAWSLRADLKMFGLAMSGRMQAEVIRLYGSAEPAEDAPLLVDE